MLLRSLTLQNFRCFGPEPTVIDFGRFTTLIGANSTGKTTIMHALRRLFSPSAHDRIVERSDFHVPKESNSNTPEHSLIIEAKLEFPELLEKKSTTATRTVPTIYHHLVMRKEGDIPYVRMRLAADLNLDGGPEGSVEQSFVFVHGDDEEAPVNNQHRSHIQFIYIPALRDPGSQIKYHAGTLRWRLMRAVAWSDDLKKKIETTAKSAQEIFEKETGYQTVRTAPEGSPYFSGILSVSVLTRACLHPSPPRVASRPRATAPPVSIAGTLGTS